MLSFFNSTAGINLIFFSGNEKRDRIGKIEERKEKRKERFVTEIRKGFQKKQRKIKNSFT